MPPLPKLKRLLKLHSIRDQGPGPSLPIVQQLSRPPVLPAAGPSPVPCHLSGPPTPPPLQLLLLPQFLALPVLLVWVMVGGRGAPRSTPR